jgi:hypothetical protein
MCRLVFRVYFGTIQTGNRVSSQSIFHINESGSSGLSTASSLRLTRPIADMGRNSQSRRASKTDSQLAPSPRLFSMPRSQ